MKLLLTSAGLANNDIRNALAALSVKPLQEATLAFIPTAANVEGGDKQWLIKDLNDCVQAGFKEIDIVDISALAKEQWLPRLQAADIIEVGGGNTAHLVHWMKQSGLDKQLPNLLENRVYVGISAGSMATAPRILEKSLQELFEEESVEGSTDEGLNLVDFLVIPHVNSPYFSHVTLENIEKVYTQTKQPLYAIDDNVAIQVIDGQVTSIGEGVSQLFADNSQES